MLKLQVWHKVHVQQVSYHNDKVLEPLQTVCAIPLSAANPYGQWDSVIISPHPTSDWPKHGLVGHPIAQLWIIFCLLHSNLFIVYIQHFHVTPQSNPTNMSTVTRMHLLKHTIRVNRQHIGEVIPLTLIHSPAHLIPYFGPKAHSRLTKLSSYKLNTEFWLNKYWSKEFYFALSPGASVLD